jgi:prepilin peptidase CpaA
MISWSILEPFLIAALLIYAAGHDMLVRTIPNTISVVLFVLGIINTILIWPIFGTMPVALFFIVFGVMALLWWFGMIGGGDAKLIPCCVLAMPTPWMGGHFILATGISGGIVSAVYLVLKWVFRSQRKAKIKRNERDLKPVPPILTPLWDRFIAVEMWRIQKSRNCVPYGVAIMIGGLVSLFF